MLDTCRYQRSLVAPTIPNIQKYCNDLSDREIITKIPNGDNNMLLIPNELNEGLVGTVLTELHKANICEYYIETRGCYIDENKIVYIVLEKAKNNTEDLIKSGKNLVHILFQIIYALYVGQTNYLFTHYDLHMGNILYEENKEIKGNIYKIQGEWVAILNPGFDIKISDYGFSRLQHANTIISPKTDIPGGRTGSIFNQLYDILSLIGYILFYPKAKLLYTNIII